MFYIWDLKVIFLNPIKLATIFFSRLCCEVLIKSESKFNLLLHYDTLLIMYYIIQTADIFVINNQKLHINFSQLQLKII